MLIVFSGLPGTGKTTLARELAGRRAATYLRIDTIEQTIRDSRALAGDIGPLGYDVAIALAEANLTIGAKVVADCVNPVAKSRGAWRAAAERCGSSLLDIEIVCSNLMEHRRRVESRSSDIPGLASPSWSSVQQHEYQPWPTERLVVDTAILSPEEALSRIDKHLGGVFC